MTPRIGERFEQYLTLDLPAHTELSAEKLGPKVRLHADLRADGYACPGCGALLAVEIRAAADAPLRDLELAGL